MSASYFKIVQYTALVTSIKDYYYFALTVNDTTTIFLFYLMLTNMLDVINFGSSVDRTAANPVVISVLPAALETFASKYIANPLR